MEFKTKGVEMKTIKERVSKKMNTAIADMRKESFKQGKWAEQKRVLGLIDEIDLKEYKDGEWYKGYNKALKEFKEELKKRIIG